jgi:hypothetical protein
MSATEVAADLVVTADADGPDFSSTFQIDDLLYLEGFDSSAITGYYNVVSISSFVPGAPSTITLDPKSGQTITGITNSAGGNENDPALMERADDAELHEDFWGYKAGRRGMPPETVLIGSQVIDFADKFSTGDAAQLSNFTPTNASVADGAVAISVTASPKRFTLASGSWVNEPENGQQVLMAGFSDGTNNGFFTVVAHTSNTIDVFETTAAEGAATGKTITAQSGIPDGQYDVVGVVSTTELILYSGTGASVGGGGTYTIAGATFPYPVTVGQTVRMEGFAQAGNNGLKTVVSSTATTIVVSETTFVEGAGQQVSMWWPSNTIYCAPRLTGASLPSGVNHVAPDPNDCASLVQRNPNGLTPIDVASTMIFYHGEETQPVSTMMEATEGAGNVPEFKRRAFFELDNLDVTKFGNRTPQFRALLQRWSNETVGSFLNKIMFDAGFSQWGGVGLNAELRGWALRGPVSAIAAIGPILIAFDILVQERFEQLWFFPRRQADVVSIDQDDLGSHEGGGDRFAPAVRVHMQPGATLPSMLEIHFTDAANDYQAGLASYGIRNPRGPEHVNIESLNFEGLTAWPWEMKNRATELFMQRYLAEQVIEVSLGPKYIHLLENDAVALTDPNTGEDYLFRILEMERGANYGLVAQGPVDDIDTVIKGSLVQSTIPPNPINLPQALIQAELLDIPAVSNLQVSTAGIYIAGTPSPGSPWRGAAVYESIDNGQSYDRIGDLQFAHTMGELDVALPAGPTAVWDTANTVRVKLFDDGWWGGFFNRTRAEVAQGANWLLVGDEILGFTTATIEDDGSWSLTDLIRGIRDTSDHVGSAVAGDRVVFLQAFGASGIFHAHRDGIGALNATRLYKFVPAGGTLTSVDPVSHTHSIEVMKCFRPQGAIASRDGSNNVTLKWERRSRAIRPLFLPGPNTMVEPQEAFDIDVINGSGAVVRTFVVTSNATDDPFVEKRIVYTALNQSADGLTPGNPVRFKLYQVGEAGRGNVLDVTL